MTEHQPKREVSTRRSRFSNSAALRRCLAVALLALCVAHASAQPATAEEVFTRLGYDVWEAASYTQGDTRYLAAIVLNPGPHRRHRLDVLLFRDTQPEPVLIYRLNDHATLYPYLLEHRMTSFGYLGLIDVDGDGHLEIYFRAGCECMGYLSKIIVDGVTRDVVAYTYYPGDEVQSYPAFFESLPAGHELAIHGAFLLGNLYAGFIPFENPRPTVVLDRAYSVEVRRPVVLPAQASEK